MSGHRQDMQSGAPQISAVPMAEDEMGRGSAEELFSQVFEDSYRPILAYVRRRLYNPSDADDVVAEVFATAWRRFDDLEATTVPLPWLYGIAGNVIRNRVRTVGRQLRLVEKAGQQPPSPGPQDPSDVVSGRLRSALEALSLDDQEILRLTAWEGLSHADTGTVLGCSTNAVGIRLHHARKRLQAAMQESEEEEAKPHGSERIGLVPDTSSVSRQNGINATAGPNDTAEGPNETERSRND